jgi:hypothetical protein
MSTHTVVATLTFCNKCDRAHYVGAVEYHNYWCSQFNSGIDCMHLEGALFCECDSE